MTRAPSGGSFDGGRWMLRSVFHEFISIRFVNGFVSWLIDEGYSSEAAMILTALESWGKKYIRHLNAEMGRNGIQQYRL